MNPIKKQYRPILIGLLIAFAALVTAELLARAFFAPDYHPFDLPLPTEASSGHTLEKLIPLAETAKPAGAVRVLVTGGSAAYGLGASSSDKDFPNQLQRLLDETGPDTRAEVLNGAVESFDAASELLLHLWFLRRLDPDVVVMFSGFNDLSNAVLNSLSPDRHKEIRELTLIRYTSPADVPAITRLLARAILLRAHHLLARLSRIYTLAANVTGHLDVKPIKSHRDYRPGTAAAELRGFADAVTAFDAVARAEGFRFLLVLQPMRPCGTRRSPGLPLSWTDVKVRELYELELLPALARLRERGVDVLDLNGAFVDTLIARGGFTDTVHLSDAGYRLAAEAAAPAVRRLLPKSLRSRPIKDKILPS